MRPTRLVRMPDANQTAGSRSRRSLERSAPHWRPAPTSTPRCATSRIISDAGEDGSRIPLQLPQPCHIVDLLNPKRQRGRPDAYDTNAGYISESTADYYLSVGRLTHTKRLDLVIDACNR